MTRPMASKENWLFVMVRVMRFNLLWYVPLAASVFFYFVVANFNGGLHNIRLVFHRFSWALFFSPAAALFFSAIIASVFIPMYNCCL